MKKKSSNQPIWSPTIFKFKRVLFQGFELINIEGLKDKPLRKKKSPTIASRKNYLTVISP